MEENLFLGPVTSNDFLIQYIDLLEKTNQQMSLFQNPYMFIVAVLTVLVTAFTIIGAFLVWRQNKDYKKAYLDAVKNYEDTLKDLVDRVGEEAKIKIDSRLKSLEKEKEKVLKSTDSGRNRKLKELDERIKELEENKDYAISSAKLSSLSNPQSSIISKPLSYDLSPNLSDFSLKPKSILDEYFCEKCGKSRDDSYGSITSLSLNPQKYCKYCGHKF